MTNINCRVCDKSISSFMSFGKMPIANGFLTESQFKDEYFFDLEVAFCQQCLMFQLTKQPDPEKMFHENYAFFSQTSSSMIKHFSNFAADLKKKLLQFKSNKSKPFIVEIGSNDGILLKNFAQDNITHLGIEPSANVAKIATDNGINTVCDFFDINLAKKIKSEYGQADLIVSANVMCHIPDLVKTREAIKILLKPDGLLIFEDPYLGDMIKKTSYDQIYDEHVFLFSANSVANAFEPVGLELIDTIHQPTHGGSMRYVLAATNKYPISNQVYKQKQYENSLGLHLANTYNNFKLNCEQSKLSLVKLLTELNNKNHTIAGYAATSKSTTVLNYCGLNKNHIAYISDTTPIKQNKFSPGTHIPIKPYEQFTANYPDYALLFGWNHAQEIFNKEQAFINSGGQWIVFVPKVEILGQVHA